MRHGRKREFRAVGPAASKLQWVKLPTPVVGYAISRRHDGAHVYHSHLMVLEATWRDELRAISEESLEREGFGSFAEFRRYWKIRTHRPFQPRQLAWAYTVRPWQPDDAARLGAQLVERLYGEFM